MVSLCVQSQGNSGEGGTLILPAGTRECFGEELLLELKDVRGGVSVFQVGKTEIELDTTSHRIPGSFPILPWLAQESWAYDP